jgi:L-fuculose-phosphate aldolase
VACYEARPDIGAVIHVHSPYVVAIAERVNFLSEEISYEFEYIMEKPVPVIPYIEPGSGDLAMAISKEISYGINGVIMRRHGSVVVGRTLREAYVRTLALERAAKTVLLANPGV